MYFLDLYAFVAQINPELIAASIAVFLAAIAILRRRCRVASDARDIARSSVENEKKYVKGLQGLLR